MDVEKIRLVTIDVSHSLLDWRKILEPFLRQDEILRFLQQLTRNRHSSLKGDYAKLLKDLCSQPDIKTLNLAWERFLQPSAIKVYEDARELNFIRHRTLVAAAGDGMASLASKLAQPFAMAWDYTWMSTDIGAFANSPTFWQGLVAEANDACQVRPDEILHVTSDSDGSIAAAQDAGVHVCYVPRPLIGSAVDGANARPDLMASDLSQVEFGLMSATNLPVRYTVTATAQHAKAAKEFINWMRREHGHDLLSIPGCTEFRVYQRSSLVTSAEYIFRDRRTLDRYLEIDAPRLRQRGLEFFPSEIMKFEREITPMMACGTSRCPDDFGGRS